jgi:hypothetical protein
MRFALGMALLAPIVVVACQRAPEPEPAPLLSAGEQACIDQAAATAGVDPATVTIAPTASTKAGATIYTVNAGTASFTCVVEVDLTVSEFSAL